MELKPQSGKVTPLWIVAAFVTLTEAVLGYAVTQVDGGVQVALTAFVIGFALLVATAFFLILWYRPYVFYSPAEYGDTDPTKFIDAMRGPLPKRIADQVDMVEQLEAKPNDASARFKIIDSLIDDPMRQYIILMNESQVELPIRDGYFHDRYELGTERGTFAMGGMSGKELAEKLAGTDLTQIDANEFTVGLSLLGKQFAKWLVDTKRKADFLKTNYGGWGTPKYPSGMPRAFHPQSGGEDGPAFPWTAEELAANDGMGGPTDSPSASPKPAKDEAEP